MHLLGERSHQRHHILHRESFVGAGTTETTKEQPGYHAICPSSGRLEFAVPVKVHAPGRQAHRADCCALTIGYIHNGRWQSTTCVMYVAVCLGSSRYVPWWQAFSPSTSTTTSITCHIILQVMNLSRRVKADVQSAIQVKDDELEKMVATMGEEELRVLVDVGPTGMEDINLWKRDRRKLSWRRLSAFGVVRNDPLLYRQWKQQQHQKVASHPEGTKTDSDEYGEMLGTTCATDVRRRQPWSTDLHYTHKGRTQQMDSTTKSNEEGNKEEKDVLPSDEGTARSGRIPRKCVHTAPSSRTSARRTTSSRPASAPLGAAARIATRPPNQSETARTPSLARLARVFYQSSVASMPCESALEYPAQTAQAPPENVHLEEIDGLETHGHEARNVGSHTEKKIIVQGRETEDNSYGKHKKSDLGGAETRMESVRLLWAVSQLSADAVTKKVMHGYSERQRAREPNRTRWKTPSRRPQPPGGRCNASVASRRKKHGSCSGRSCVG